MRVSIPSISGRRTTNMPEAKARPLIESGFAKPAGEATEYTYEQSGSWYYIYEGETLIAKVQGKAKLADYGIELRS